MTEQRRLAAILVADVVGYSKLIGGDEAGTLAQLQALRTEVIDPQIAQHAGRLFRRATDLDPTYAAAYGFEVWCIIACLPRH